MALLLHDYTERFLERGNEAARLHLLTQGENLFFMVLNRIKVIMKGE